MKRTLVITTLVICVIFSLIFILNRDVKPKALVAFVIDDWGYNKKNVELAFAIERPLTIAILPNLRYSKYIADNFSKNSGMYDIMLHLPLESRNNTAAEVNTIRSNMEREKILSILDDDIKSIPGIIGASNHQGSKATGDKRVMMTVLGELKKRELFFLDSVTTPNSVCSGIANDIGLRYAQRDVFLDITDETDLEHFDSYIKKQIQELADIAMEQGSAIGVGHNKMITLKAIKDSIPELERKGIKIVLLKELVK